MTVMLLLVTISLEKTEVCVMARCRYATTSSLIAQFCGKVLAHFPALEINITVVCRIDCLACYDKFFTNKSMLLSLRFTCLALFGLSEFTLFHWEDFYSVSRS
jgi:hypothetical protein